MPGTAYEAATVEQPLSYGGPVLPVRPWPAAKSQEQVHVLVAVAAGRHAWRTWRYRIPAQASVLSVYRYAHLSQPVTFSCTVTSVVRSAKKRKALVCKEL